MTTKQIFMSDLTSYPLLRIKNISKKLFFYLKIELCLTENFIYYLKLLKFLIQSLNCTLSIFSTIENIFPNY